METCRMGAIGGRIAVVDSEGNVLDASIRPTIRSAKTNLPILMLTERMGQHTHLSECHHYGRSEFLHAVVAKASYRGVERCQEKPALGTTFFSGRYLIARINTRGLRCPPAKSGCDYLVVRPIT
jgi:Choline dehydrogenase and related flavoproteins